MGGVTSSELLIPINPDGDYPVIVAVHGEVTGPTNETAWGEGEQIADGGSWAMYNHFVIDECDLPPVDLLCVGFKTLTQDQWGDETPGSEAEVIMSDDFLTLAGLNGTIAVGCDVDTMEWDNGADMQAYLPDNSALTRISQSYFNPVTSVSGMAGEAVTLRLNLAADANILGFSTAGSALGDQQYIEFNNYFGLTVNQCMLDAERNLTGCLLNNLTELDGVLIAINGSYANGNDGAGILFCPFGS